MQGGNKRNLCGLIKVLMPTTYIKHRASKYQDHWLLRVRGVAEPFDLATEKKG